MDRQIGISYQRFTRPPMGPYCLACAESKEDEEGEKWPTGNTDTGLSTLPHFAEDGEFTCPICGELIGE